MQRGRDGRRGLGARRGFAARAPVLPLLGFPPLLLSLLLLLLLPEVAAARGPIYRFVDDRGVVHYTNIHPTDQRFYPVPTAPEHVPVPSRSRAEPPLRKRQFRRRRLPQ